MNVIWIVNIRTSFPALNSQQVCPLLNLHLKQTEGHENQTRDPADFRIFITIFKSLWHTTFFFFWCNSFTWLNLRHIRNIRSPLPIHRRDKSLTVQMPIYGQISYKSDSSMHALRMALGSESHSSGMFPWELWFPLWGLALTPTCSYKKMSTTESWKCARFLL